MRFTSSIAALALAALAASAGDDLNRVERVDHVENTPRSSRSTRLKHIAPTNLVWVLPPKVARIEGSTLIVGLSPGDPTNTVHCEAPLDLSGLLDDGTGLILTIRVRAEDVTKPAHSWNGVKFMLRYEDADTGKTHYPGASLPIGTYGWRTVTNRVNILTAPVNPVDGRATLVLGLQESTGRVEFDLDSLSITSEDVGVSRVNQDWIVRYPGDGNFNAKKQRGGEAEGAESEISRVERVGHVENSPRSSRSTRLNDSASLPLCVKKPLRGCMLPHATKEEDIATLAAWGATLVRFQIARNWTGVDDNQDLAEYAAWVDSRLDNLADVLEWCNARGIACYKPGCNFC